MKGQSMPLHDLKFLCCRVRPFNRCGIACKKKAMFEFGGSSIKPIGKNQTYDKQLMERP